jgi:hypothetical protein
MPGQGTMTPISGGAASGISYASSIPFTWLSLTRYARILGVHPVHFQGAVGQAVWPFEKNACSNIWPRHSWQNSDQVSREDLAFAIKQAEDEVSSYVGYPLAPTWISNRTLSYPQYHRNDMYGIGGRDVRGKRKSVNTKTGKIISAGRRATTLIDTATVVDGSLSYTDEDGDGFSETATITLATTLSNACEIKTYFSGTLAAPEWEIRWPRSSIISGGNIQLVYDSWLFIDPSLQSAYPTTDGFTAVDISTINNFVTEVDIYREYTDNTSVSARFFWEPANGNVVGCSQCGSTGCTECSYTTQDGCLLIRDVETGFVVPSPATYDSDTGLWNTAAYSVCRDPDRILAWYQAGDMDEAFLRGDSCDPLSDFFARIIAWIATARLERPFCQCGNVTALAESWREDLAFQGESSAYLVDFNLLGAAFGTKRGEMMAFKALSMLNKRKISAGAV